MASNRDPGGNDTDPAAQLHSPAPQPLGVGCGLAQPPVAAAMLLSSLLVKGLDKKGSKSIHSPQA